MRKLIFTLIAAVVLLIATFGVIQYALGQAPDGQVTLSSENSGDSKREIYAPAGDLSPQQPNIGFIDSPTVGCYQPDPGQNSCNINWYYMNVDASPNSMISMTVTINSIGLVANYQGFFQTSMYVPFNMTGTGFKVACGSLGAGGNPLLGNAYAWTIRAKDNTGLSSANYGTVYCPARKP